MDMAFLKGSDPLHCCKNMAKLPSWGEAGLLIIAPWLNACECYYEIPDVMTANQNKTCKPLQPEQGNTLCVRPSDERVWAMQSHPIISSFMHKEEPFNCDTSCCQTLSFDEWVDRRPSAGHRMGVYNNAVMTDSDEWDWERASVIQSFSRKRKRGRTPGPRSWAHLISKSFHY